MIGLTEMREWILGKMVPCNRNQNILERLVIILPEIK